MKRDCSILRSIVLASAALAASACASPGSGNEAPAATSNSDAAGDVLVAGKVRIAAIDRSRLATEGVVAYRLENATREDVENLSARIVFYYPPTQGGDIALPFDTDVSDETSFTLVRGKTDYEIAATSRAFAERSSEGDQITTKIDVVQAAPIALTARDGSNPGTRVLNDHLECVAISPEDLRLGLGGGAPRLWIEFRNVSSRPESNVVVQAVFLDSQGERMTYESGWSRLPNLAVGESGRVEFELEDASKVRNRPFVVRVRRRSVR